MYTVKAIQKIEHLIVDKTYREDEYKLTITDDDNVQGHVYLKGSSTVQLLSRWPKDVKDFDLEKHVFRFVRDLQVGDEIAHY